MFSLRRASARIGRWPRFAAIGICLLLALGSALGSARARGPQAPPTDAVVVAAGALPAGRVLTAGDLRVSHWPPALRPAGTSSDPRRLVGETLAGPLAAREAVTRGRLLGAGLTTGLPTGTVAVAVTLGVDPGELLHAGDRLDLVVVPGDPLDLPGGRPIAVGPPTVVATRALVLAVTRVVPGGASPGARVVLAADRPTALRIAGVSAAMTFAAVADHP